MHLYEHVKHLLAGQGSQLETVKKFVHKHPMKPFWKGYNAWLAKCIEGMSCYVVAVLFRLLKTLKQEEFNV